MIGFMWFYDAAQKKNHKHKHWQDESHWIKTYERFHFNHFNWLKFITMMEEKWPWIPCTPLKWRPNEWELFARFLHSIVLVSSNSRALFFSLCPSKRTKDSCLWIILGVVHEWTRHFDLLLVIQKTKQSFGFSNMSSLLFSLLFAAARSSTIFFSMAKSAHTHTIANSMVFESVSLERAFHLTQDICFCLECATFFNQRTN